MKSVKVEKMQSKLKSKKTYEEFDNIKCYFENTFIMKSVKVSAEKIEQTKAN